MGVTFEVLLRLVNGFANNLEGSGVDDAVLLVGN
jgi:hypothetical protein